MNIPAKVALAEKVTSNLCKEDTHAHHISKKKQEYWDLHATPACQNFSHA